MRFTIELSKTALGTELSGGFAKGWRKLPAWPTPASPDIHQERHITFALFAESRGI